MNLKRGGMGNDRNAQYISLKHFGPIIFKRNKKFIGLMPPSPKFLEKKNHNLYVRQCPNESSLALYIMLAFSLTEAYICLSYPRQVKTIST